MSVSRPNTRNNQRGPRDAPTATSNVRRPAARNTGPPLPSGLGLSRETTSFGVFSNLSSHNRDVSKPLVPSTDECTLATTGIQSKMLESARKGDVATLRRLLYDNTQLPLNFADEDGRTLLHHGVASRCEDVLELVLKKKTPVLDYTDKIGDTALHLGAREGLTMVVYQLLKTGSDVNKRNKLTGRTALHEAVARKHRHVAEVLLYHGADISIRDTDKKSVTDVSTPELSGRELERMLENRREKRIEIQMFKLSATVTYQSLDVILNTNNEAVRNDVVLAIFRRQDVDVTTTTVPVQDQEEIASDVISYDIYGLPENVKVTVTMPIYNVTLTSREELGVKTFDGENVVPENVFKKDNTWMCEFRTTLKSSGAFVAVCRIKTDTVEVSRAAKVMTSSVDQRVRINIHANCFPKPGLLSMEILELSDDVEMEEGQIISSTPFYKVHCDQKLSAPLILQLPEPADYGQQTQLAVLLHGTEGWTVAADKDVVQKAGVTCSVNSLPIHAVVTKVKPGADRDVLVSELSHMFSLLQSRTYTVCFLCLAKRVESENKFEVVVECCESKLADTRRKELHLKGFEDQPTAEAFDGFECDSKQTFTVAFYENTFIKKNGRYFRATFHPKRKNCVQFEIKLKGKVVQFVNGRISIYKGLVDDTNSSNPDTKPIASTDITLMMNALGQSTTTEKAAVRPAFERSHTTSRIVNNVRPATERPVTRDANRTQIDRQNSRTSVSSAGSSIFNRGEPVKGPNKVDAMDSLKKSLIKAVNNVDPITDEQRAQFEKEVETTATPVESESPREVVQDVITPDDDNKIVFLQDRLLLSVLEDLQEEWYKILTLMDVPFSQIEDMLVTKGDTNRKINKLFLSWRDSKQDRPDIGLPQLLSALFKGGRRDIANTIQVSLRKWHGSTSNKDCQFYKWTTEAYQDSNMLVPTDYPKPMSDQFLVLMSDELSPNLELARALNLEESRLQEVLKAEHLLLDGIKAMKMLTLFRDSVSIRIDALEAMISALGKTGNDAMRRYAIMCAKAWVKRTATRKDDPFRYQVDTLLAKLTTE